jgi:hypothetical protein
MSPPDEPPVAETPRLLEPPRFTLRALLGWVTALCALLALLVSLPRGLAWVAGGLAALIAAHVLGNSLGTRLRALGRGSQDRMPPDRPIAPASPIQSAPPLPVTRLGEKHRLSRTMPIATAAAATLGAVVGGLLLAWFNHPQGTVPGMVLGGLSCGFLGGFAGFLASSFLEIFGRAWNEAAALAPDPPRRRRRWLWWLS